MDGEGTGQEFADTIEDMADLLPPGVTIDEILQDIEIQDDQDNRPDSALARQVQWDSQGDWQESRENWSQSPSNQLRESLQEESGNRQESMNGPNTQLPESSQLPRTQLSTSPSNFPDAQPVHRPEWPSSSQRRIPL